MSTHTAVRTQLDVSHVGDLVDSLTERASSAISKFDVVKTDLQRVQTQPANDSRLPSPWFQPLPTQSNSPLGKSGTFALVAAAHVLVFFGLANLPQSVREQFTAPLQVVSIVEERVAHDVPPPPKPQIQNFDVPVEPIVINIADPDSMAITVRAEPQEVANPVQSGPSVEATAVSAADFIVQPNVKYPAVAKALKQRGTVLVRMLVDEQGHVVNVSIAKSSGFRILDEAAIKAVADVQLRPRRVNGNPVSVYALLPIEFSHS
jgi:protein TonB